MPKIMMHKLSWNQQTEIALGDLDQVKLDSTKNQDQIKLFMKISGPQIDNQV